MSELAPDEMVHLYVTGRLPDYVKVKTVPAVLDGGVLRPSVSYGKVADEGVALSDIPSANVEDIPIHRYRYGNDDLWAGYGPQSKTLVIAVIDG